ncbi:MAG: hypothetical protein VKP62_16205 [Candidatus Sericytochromatia bacterium]|nr:hypothetical protein [Candidatus Sericytochromatia bacterium]
MGSGTPGKANTLRFTYLDWPRVLENLRAELHLLDGAKWHLGEMLLSVRQTLAGTPGVAAAFASQGVSWRALGNRLGMRASEVELLSRVSEAFPKGKRVSGVGWEHHRVVLFELPAATLSQRHKWLREAARQEWNPTQLGVQIRKALSGSKPQGRDPVPRDDQTAGRAPGERKTR